MLILYDYELSAEAYAARLMLGFLGLDYEPRPVDMFPGAEHLGAAFREISPLGRMPVLKDGEVTLSDWQAILVHLAATRDPARTWLPDDPGGLGAIVQWLGTARSLAASAGLARDAAAMGVAADVEACRREARALLRFIDEHLWFQEQDGRAWLLDGSLPTLADLAPFPAIMLCEEGGIDRRDYPAIRRWSDRFRRMPGFTPMSGVFPAAPAA